MKKILLLVLPLLAFAFISKAQLTYSLTADTSYISLADDGVKHKAEFDITNPGTADLILEWQIEDFFKPWTWSAPGICDWEQCYGFADKAWHTVTVPAGTTRTLYIEMGRNPSVETGCAFGRVNYRQQGMSSNQVELKHTSHATFAPCGPLATANIEKEVVSVYPNPTHNVINLNVINKNVKSVQLSNLIGKQIQNLSISSSNGGVHQLSLQALPKGIYILQFKSENGRVLGVTRITKR